MNNLNQTPYDVKKTVKTGFLYLLIAFPFVLFVATVLTIVKAPLAVIMLCNIVTAGGVVFLEYVVHNKIKEKRNQNKDSKSDFDPFKD